MSWIAVGVGGAAVVGGIGGALISSNAASSAADKQTAAANSANDLQHQQFEEQRSDQAPWRQAGAQALSQMGDPSFQHDFGMADFQKDPGYDFRMAEGQKALERSAAARGGLMNGGTLKALTQYGQGMASDEYQNAYNRFTNNQSNRFNRLSSIAGTGQTANAQVGAAGQNMANQVGQNTMGAANAAGAAGIAGGNAWNGALSGIGNTGVRTWMDYQMMDRFAPQGATAGGGALSGLSAGGGSSAGGAVTPYTYNSPNFGPIAGG